MSALARGWQALRPRIHDRYVARAVLASVLMAWAVLLGFDLIGAVVQELGDLGGGYTFGLALLNVLFTVPRRLYDLFPSAAVVGSILALGGLASTSELTALRAAGISRLRICMGAVLALVALTAVMIVNGETLGPSGEARATSLAASAKSGDSILSRFSGLWARDGEVFVNVRAGSRREAGQDSFVELADVRLYEFDADGRLATLTRARSAELRPDDRSVLEDVRRIHFTPREARVEIHAEVPWETSLDGESLASSMTRPRYLSTAQLSQTIDYMRANSLYAGEYEAFYWARWFYPLNVLALCLAAMPFAFGQLRSGGFGKRLFLGIVFGLGFFLVQRIVTQLAEAYDVDLRLASLVTPLVLGGVAVWQYRRQA
ncbi:LPS export ABC transporter permease LptG [Coralloluteibacterium stylophorae]|uniref:LPS export ABC transporter permease LptG n=1 Tax=Coralloluteibacterium stylophorae TaxID=1776034 RepID=A0A8J8AYD1_9GAMM|nr:LPS export ABC transporter permease LptG [Coralloluteibacterium stylophorae]MBS7457790.1 LPS export ABC transporter permease LptG [Coralloluteibacterium stylophorae]